MIAVVADDLTGAAELGGIGLRYNLAVEVQTEFNPATNTDLLIINTDSRSKKESMATADTAAAMEQLVALQPEFIYKKIDSVLRGHVLPEIKAQLRTLNLKKALVVPANPNLGRTISQGTYFLHGVPIHESSFAQDPEFPVHSAQVINMVRPNGVAVHVQNHLTPQPGDGILIGEASTGADLKAWAATVKSGTALAGAAGFFTALLESHGHLPSKTGLNVPAFLEAPSLFVCGSTFGKSRKLVKTVSKNGGPVSYMPTEILVNPELLDSQFEAWAEEIINLLRSAGKAIIAINPVNTKSTDLSADQLREKTARVVPKIFSQITPKELFLEGGSTASAVLRHLGYSRFYPVNELAPGVIRMQVAHLPNLHLTLKPGSYDWPATVWNFN